MNRTPIFQILAAGIFVLLIGSAGSLYGQQIQLSLDVQSISFAAADPDTTPQVPANQSVRVSIRVQGGGSHRPWQLTLTANGNLSDFWSIATIDISNISWTATPSSPFQDGTLAANVDQLAASGSSNVFQSGDLSFLFRNSWTYWAGSYTQTVTFTLSQL